MKRSLRFLRHLLEYGVVWAFYHLCRLGSLSFSSAWAGALAGWVGPKLGISHVARRNLRLALPDLTQERHEEIVQGMWENLGRTFGEYPHLGALDILSPQAPVTIEGHEILERLQAQGTPVIFFLGHMANWEYATMPARRWGFSIAQLFRPLNNPLLAYFITAVHRKIAPDLVTKGQQGARQMIEVLKKGRHLSMLVDQKLNEGLPIPFFGHDAMTAPAIARLALKFKAAIIPVQVIRQDRHFCQVIYHDPLIMPQDMPGPQAVESLLKMVNMHLETWIRQRPQDWLWIHKRWPQSR